ncbi:hypothetical protein [Candidatus Amarobacter glycogenicus]|uniref:hypothetical protein n=1 Tax=Candidatus Amarobacter glycogenicus TaxID=3140699 RepID=UPI002A10E749|nr:hypothetical protein [Dehalococcoidia bacterium]
MGDSYQDVHAEYITGGNADLKPGTSANVDIDIDPAETSTTIAISIPSPSPIGTSFTITATVDAPLNPFPPSPVVIPQKVEYYAGATLIQSVIVSAAMCPRGGQAMEVQATDHHQYRRPE